MTTTNQNTELAKPVTRVVYFAELHFVSGTQRVSTFNNDITWGGYTWGGLGQLGSIAPLSESDSMETAGVNLTLNTVAGSWLSEAMGSVSDYRAQPVNLYMCPLDQNYLLIDTPELCWSGFMDTMTVGVAADGGAAITLKCESAAFGLKRRAVMRLNQAQWQARTNKLYGYTDTGMKYLNALIANPQLWLSKKFQQVS